MILAQLWWPSLVLPFNNDQKINAWLIKKNNLGIPCSPGALTGKHVKLLVEKLIRDVEIRKSLKHFKNLLKEINGPKSAVDKITSFTFTTAVDGESTKKIFPHQYLTK